MVKVIFKARTEAKPCLGKGLRDLHFPHFGDKGDATHVQKGSLGVKSQGITPDHNESCSSQKSSLQDPPSLRRHVHSEEGPRVGQMWKKKWG